MKRDALGVCCNLQRIGFFDACDLENNALDIEIASVRACVCVCVPPCLSVGTVVVALICLYLFLMFIKVQVHQLMCIS